MCQVKLFLKFAFVKKIIGYLKKYFREEFNVWALLGTVILLVILTGYNYFHPYLKQAKLELSWDPRLFLYYFILFSIPFFGTHFIQAIVKSNFEIFKKPAFWFLSCFAILIFSLRSISHILANDLFPYIEHSPLAYFWYSIILSVFRMMLILVPIFIYWYLKDKKKEPLYGFTLKGYDTTPYVVMLLVMIPLIALASFQSDFLDMYPRGGELQGLDPKKQADLKYFGLYELVYGLDFVFIEFYFRGFLVMAFVHLAGPSAILPMAAFYVVIHFGKPLGETISSFFGGSLLGIISYYSRSIAGGIIVHMGIAWLMEMAAFIQKITDL